VLAGLSVAVALLPAVAGTAAGQVSDPQQELDDVESQLDDARGQLDSVEGQQAVTLADLQEADARRSELEVQLAALNAELAAAQGALEEAERRLDTTTSRLTDTEEHLGDTRNELVDRRDRLQQRIRATYMYGSVDPTDLLPRAQDVAEFNRALVYLETVLDSDQSQIEGVTALEVEVEVAADELAGLQAEEAQATATRESERDRVAGLVVRQEELAASAASETERHRLILTQLEADEESSRQLIDNLEADSARLEEELRRRAEEAAARAAEAARSAAAARAAADAAARARQPASNGSSGSGAGGSALDGSASFSAPASSGQMQQPVNAEAGSPFGYRIHPIFHTSRLHTGIDFGAPSGTPIFAADSGVVVSAGTRGGYGNATVVDHGGGTATLYAHQSRLGVTAGQQVTRGEVIGYVGSTGYSTGPHLHFEVRINGTPVDPAPYL